MFVNMLIYNLELYEFVNRSEFLSTKIMTHNNSVKRIALFFRVELNHEYASVLYFLSISAKLFYESSTEYKKC